MFPFLGAIASAIGGAIGKAAVMAKSAAIGLGKGMIPGMASQSSPLALGSGASPGLAAGAMKLGQGLGQGLQKQMGLDRLLGGNLLGGPQQGAPQQQQASPEQMPSVGGQTSNASPMGSAALASPQSNKSIEDLFKEAKKKGLI